MAILRKLKRMLSPEEPTMYECQECGTAYEAMDEEHKETECPACGAGGAAAVPQL